MKISVILGHPYENSFNSAVAETVVKSIKENGHTVMFHDLYRENFNPVMPKDELADDQERILWSGSTNRRFVKPMESSLFTQIGGDSPRRS